MVAAILRKRSAIGPQDDGVFRMSGLFIGQRVFVYDNRRESRLDHGDSFSFLVRHDCVLNILRRDGTIQLLIPAVSVAHHPCGKLGGLGRAVFAAGVVVARTLGERNGEAGAVRSLHIIIQPR